MSKSEQISHMTNIMAKFVGYTGKVLPDDVTAKLEDLHKKETSKLADVIFTTMIENQRLAKELDRPSCRYRGDSVSGGVRGELPADRRTGSAAA